MVRFNAVPFNKAALRRVPLGKSQVETSTVSEPVQPVHAALAKCLVPNDLGTIVVLQGANYYFGGARTASIRKNDQGDVRELSGVTGTVICATSGSVELVQDQPFVDEHAYDFHDTREQSPGLSRTSRISPSAPFACCS